MSEFTFPPGYDVDRWLSSERRHSASLLVLHEPHRSVPRCATCQGRLNGPGIWSLNWDGDCLECAVAASPESFEFGD